MHRGRNTGVASPKEVHEIDYVYRYFGVTLNGNILTINYGVLGAVSIDANTCHPNDVVYTAFTQLKLPKSMVSIPTSSKLRFHTLLCGGNYAYHVLKFCGGKYTTINSKEILW
jgi:hypothetical protein